MVTTVIVGGPVVTVDADRRVIDPGAVALDGDRIVAVGPRDEVLDAHPDADRIDRRGHAILPGLVDSHGHAGHGLTKNLGEGTGKWLSAVRDLYFRATGESFWEAEGRLAALERLQVGVTTSLSYVGSMPRVDHPRYARAAAQGYAEFGLRHVVGIGPPSTLPATYEDPDRDETTTVDIDHALDTTERVVDDLHGAADGRLSVAISPSSLVSEVDDAGAATDAAAEELRRSAELAADRDLAFHAHAYGGMVEAAAEACPDALTDRLFLAHCAGLSEAELDLLAEHGVGASHGPLTHAYASDRFPVVEAMERGIRLAISTDGSGPDRSFDLLSQGRVAAQLQRAHFGDTALMPAGKVLEAMTVDAADLLGMADEVGSLESGKRADVVAIDLQSARLGPRPATGQVVPRLVGYADGSDVSLVVVDGEVLFRDGEVVVDGVPSEDEVLDAAADQEERAIDRAGVTDLREAHPDLWGEVRFSG
jgi:5-methylthioadenosine/S-adenosylhomocysteine deaminase